MKFRFFLISLLILIPMTSWGQGKVSSPKKQNPPRKESVNPQRSSGKKISGASNSIKSNMSVPPGTLQKNTLYTFERNELLYYNEFASNFKANDNKFALITIDTITKKQTLIINGKKEITGDQIFSPYLDLSNNKKIYAYKIGGEWFVNMNGNKEGPYEAVGWNNLDQPTNFNFKRMGKIYNRDENGFVTHTDATNVWNVNVPEPSYLSFNKNQKLKFSSDLRSAQLNGKSYNFQLPAAASDISIYNVYVSNKGSALFCINYTYENRLNHRYLKLSNGSLTDFLDNWINFNNELSNIQEGDGFINGIPFIKAIELIEDIGSWDEGLNLTLKDLTDRHLFTSAWNYDYVLIDNNKIPCAPPFFAFYDKSADSFVWISQERNQIIMYSYKL